MKKKLIMDNQFWSLILPVCLFLVWLVFGAGIAYYYWLKKDDKRATKWLWYSVLIWGVISLVGGIY